MAQEPKKRIPVLGVAKGKIHVPDSSFEPLPDDMLRAFNGEVDDSLCATFNRELEQRLAAVDRGEIVDPAVLRARLQQKSQQRRNEDESMRR